MTETVEVPNYGYVYEYINIKGKRVKVYYITQKTRQKIDGILDLHSSFSLLRNDLDLLKKRVNIIQELLSQDLTEHIKQRMIESLKDRARNKPDKNFHMNDLIPYRWAYLFTSNVHEAFRQLLSEGMILKGNSGWYKLNFSISDVKPADIGEFLK